MNLYPSQQEGVMLDITEMIENDPSSMYATAAITCPTRSITMAVTKATAFGLASKPPSTRKTIDQFHNPYDDVFVVWTNKSLSHQQEERRILQIDKQNNAIMVL